MSNQNPHIEFKPDFGIFHDISDDRYKKAAAQALEQGLTQGRQQGLAEGLELGWNQGLEAGIAQGTREENSRFWDIYQNYGQRTVYNSAFCNTAFTRIDPKYNVVATAADSMMTGLKDLTYVNWEKFNLSNVSSLYQAFSFCENLESVDTDLAVTSGGATLCNSVFREAKALKCIKKITSYPTAVWKQSFENCKALTHVIFDGTIGQNGLNLQWSTGLDKESITSVIHALSTTTSGLSVTLSRAAVEQAFGSTEAEEWVNLIADYSNWTISLM